MIVNGFGGDDGSSSEDHQSVQAVRLLAPPYRPVATTRGRSDAFVLSEPFGQVIATRNAPTVLRPPAPRLTF